MTRVIGATNVTNANDLTDVTDMTDVTDATDVTSERVVICMTNVTDVTDKTVITDLTHVIDRQYTEGYQCKPLITIPECCVDVSGDHTQIPGGYEVVGQLKQENIPKTNMKLVFLAAIKVIWIKSKRTATFFRDVVPMTFIATTVKNTILGISS